MERVVVKTRVKQGYINIFYEHLNDNQILRFNHEFPENIGHFTLNWKNWICLNERAYVVFISISIFCDKFQYFVTNQ